MIESDYQIECERICKVYKNKLSKVFSYEYSELEFDFLGFLGSYKMISKRLPSNFTIIDLGCYQAVQALYFSGFIKYIGVDIGCPISSRWGQNNAE